MRESREEDARRNSEKKEWTEDEAAMPQRSKKKNSMVRIAKRYGREGRTDDE